MTDRLSRATTSTAQMSNDSHTGKIINDSLHIFFKDAVMVTLKRPSQALFFYRTVKWQQKAARVRADWEHNGLHVPPIILFSITNRCNLNCKGCYHQALRSPSHPELDNKKLRSIIAEAKELGISFFVMVGGEPFLRPEILDIAQENPDILFLVFTNGLLINNIILEKLSKQKNVVPVISFEGYEVDTDARRGQGVYARIQKTIEKLKERGVFWSVSLTVTRWNFADVTDEQFVKEIYDMGCRLFFYVEYTPVREGTTDWLPTQKQRYTLIARRNTFRKKFPALFITIPGDEKEVGGCLSAGRGFIHISAEGDIEPCPFAPYSDTSLRDSSLKDALQSPFLKLIREKHDELRETEGGCILWAKRDWVQSQLHGGTEQPLVGGNGSQPQPVPENKVSEPEAAPEPPATQPAPPDNPDPAAGSWQI